jgi:hypothetical protein
MTSQYKGSKGGFPIRKSSDQSSFAAPQGLSQRTTSFIASQRQGIHRMLLRHLIALMINVRYPRQKVTDDQKDLFPGFHPRTLLAKHTRPEQPHRPSLVHRDKCPVRRMCSLFTMSNIRAPSRKEQARTSKTFPDPVNGGARRDRTDDLLNANQALSQLSYGPLWRAGLRARKPSRIQKMVGLGRLERPTSPLSGVRSNHLSYRPVPLAQQESTREAQRPITRYPESER